MQALSQLAISIFTKLIAVLLPQWQRYKDLKQELSACAERVDELTRKLEQADEIAKERDEGLHACQQLAKARRRQLEQAGIEPITHHYGE